MDNKLKTHRITSTKLSCDIFLIIQINVMHLITKKIRHPLFYIPRIFALKKNHEIHSKTDTHADVYQMKSLPLQ